MDLKATLDALYATYHTDYLSTDPLEIARRYDDPGDQEIVGFIAAALALGRVDPMRKAIQDLLLRIGPSPSRFVEAFDPSRDSAAFDGFVYRFYRNRDVALLVWWLKQILQEASSLRAFFLRQYDETESNIGPSLSRFVRAVLALKTKPLLPSLLPRGSGIRHFLADPSDGSGCKRLNLFLRWMVRRDGLDLGLWQEVSPTKLIIPLDTHVARIGQRIGLTQRTSPDWKMAVEITETLRRFDPNDPVKYDFALCRVGMLHTCPSEPNRSKCEPCPVFRFCKVARVRHI